jgi:hypothetical protein
MPVELKKISVKTVGLKMDASLYKAEKIYFVSKFSFDVFKIWKQFQNGFKSSQIVLWPTVSRPVCLGVRHPFRTRDQFSLLLSLIIFIESYGFSDVGRPLWREVGSVFFSFCWASPAQPLSGLSPTGLIFLFLRLSKAGEPDSCIYFPLEQGSTVLPPDIGFSERIYKPIFSI